MAIKGIPARMQPLKHEKAAGLKAGGFLTDKASERKGNKASDLKKIPSI